MGSLTSIYVFACVFLSILWNNIQPTVENKITANYSGHLLTEVPKNIPVHTHILDLSHNSISEITNFRFTSLSDLQVLNLSHNLITGLKVQGYYTLDIYCTGLQMDIKSFLLVFITQLNLKEEYPYHIYPTTSLSEQRLSV